MHARSLARARRSRLWHAAVRLVRSRLAVAKGDLQVQKVKYEHFDLNLKRVYWFRDLSKYQFNSVWCLITKRVIELLQDQVKESKDHALQVFEHKSRVTDILHKYMSKRPVKKRDVKIMS